MSSKIDYRIPKASIEGKSEDAVFWAVIAKAWPDAEEFDVTKKLQFATPGQRAILATTLFIREVDNGGLEQFFHNETGDIAQEVILGFERLGSPENAEIVRQALTFFGPGSAIASQSARRDSLQKTSRTEKDGFFEPLNQKLYGEPRLWPLFRRYLDQHPDEFFV